MKNRRPVQMLLIGFFLIPTAHCWKKQAHDIVSPKIPHYLLSGTIRDIDTEEILKGCEVRVVTHELIYETEPIDMIDTTDAFGFYEFEGVVPGEYFLIVKRGQYQVNSDHVVISHEDKTFDSRVPKVLLSTLRYYYEGSNIYGSRKSPKLNGICWIDPSTLAGVWPWKEHSDDLLRYRIVTGDYQIGFKILGESKMETEIPEIWGLTFLTGYYTFAKSSSYPYYKLLSINPSDGNIQKEIDFPYSGQDLTQDGQNIWAITNSKRILQLSSNGSKIIQEYKIPNENPGGIGWNGQTIWTSDMGAELIYEHDQNLGIKKTFRPIYENRYLNSYTISGIKYLSFDNNKELWASNGNTIYLLKEIDL